MVAGEMSSVNTAEMAVLVATPVVGPGVVVAGTVEITPGRVVSAVNAVLKLQTKLLPNGTPCVSIAPVVMVAVHVTPAGSAAPGEKVAERLALA